DYFLKALERDPDNADIYHNLGESYRHLGDTGKAMPCFAKAIELRPELFMAYRSAADTALAAMEKAEKPEHAAQLKRLAMQYRRALGAKLHKLQHREAMGVLRETLEIDPFDVETLVTFGRCLMAHGIVSEAEQAFRRAIAIDPKNGHAYCELGVALYALRRWDEEQDAFETAIRINPNDKISRVNLVTCDLMHQLYEDEPTPEEIYRRHRAWGESFMAELAPEAAAEAKPFTNSRDPDRRLRIAFLSGDFRDHPVAQFLRPLLAHHDRSAIEVYCYTEHERTDHYTPVLQQLGGIWRFASVLESDANLRAQLRDDEIDIAIDLAGQTAGTRLFALAVRATPVTATWLGYPATTGLPAIDWRITDALADPPGYESQYVERLIRLPDGFLCYQPRPESPPVAPLPALTRGAITFGSFNNVMKVTPRTVRCWAAVLTALPSARLVLKAAYLADPVTRASFIDQFTALGIDIARVELRSQVAELGGHFGAYGEIDIALDPLAYNGTTTSCEALWMGVPVITMIGDRHAARVGFDLLSRVGLSELAAADVDGYVALAVGLANDLPRLEQLRRGLRERMRQSPLCDPQRFARQFEAALREMWRDWCAQPH
ncbi:MAG TPA: tetratricopeptide repeat protein, partial [Stellaceae bacterium]|nr:tetratricopeptide repeat protein [Stellaceae bacterium]